MRLSNAAAIAAAAIAAYWAQAYVVHYWLAIVPVVLALFLWRNNKDRSDETIEEDPQPTDASDQKLDESAPSKECVAPAVPRDEGENGEPPDWVEPPSEIRRGPQHTPLKLNNTFTEPKAETFKVRGKTYLSDSKKVPSEGPPMFAPIGVQNYMKGDGANQIRHACQEVPSLCEHIRSHPDDFFFVVTWLIPGPPFRSVVFAWQRRRGALNPVLEQMWDEFLEGDDETRKSRFKYLPRLDEAPRLVLGGVRTIGGERPTMLSNKLTSDFVRGPNYLEIDVDISSSKIANTVTGLIVPKIKKVVVSHAFLLEAHTEDELPEVVMASIRTQGVQMMENTVTLADSS